MDVLKLKTAFMSDWLTMIVIIDTHLTSRLRSVNIDLLLSLVIEGFDGHDTIIGLSLAGTLGGTKLLLLILKGCTSHLLYFILMSINENAVF